MKNIVSPQITRTPETESLFLASLILRDVHEIQRGIHMIVAILLRYAEMGAAITDSLIGWSTPTVSMEN
jgi:hypothetical protein